MSTTIRRSAITITTLLLLGWGAACSPESIVDNADLPPDVADPALTKTPAGAVAAYYGTLSVFSNAFGGDIVSGIPGGSFVPVSGELSDELHAGSIGAPNGVSGTSTPIDIRRLPECPFGVPSASCNEGSYEGLYSVLQRVRANGSEARGLLAAYAPDSVALIGHLYALSAYAETFLADLFCSGVPLSTIDFDGDYTLRPGSTTEEVYEHARLFFDSALTLAADSDRIVNLARIGKGRALLALGQYAAAAQAVADVPDGFQYRELYSASTPSGGTVQNYLNFGYVSGVWPLTVADTEGIHGLDYRSSGDPRTAATALTTKNTYQVVLYHPNKYATAGTTPIVVANWIEARLIEAEAALQAGGTSWLAILNALRTDGTFDTHPNAQDTTKTDTLWHAGTGGVAGLAPLDDPVDPDARVDLVFHERAFWLYLTGHRQGDLRRLIRQYGRTDNAVYPTGPYSGGAGSYGSDVTIPVPARERQGNPQYSGCFHRGA